MAATISKRFRFMSIPRSRELETSLCQRYSSVVPDESLLLELLHLLVQLVHLVVDLFLFQDAFAHQQRRQAVEQDAVLDDHLLELFIVIGAIPIALNVVHLHLLFPAHGVSQNGRAASSGRVESASHATTSGHCPTSRRMPTVRADLRRIPDHGTPMKVGLLTSGSVNDN